MEKSEWNGFCRLDFEFEGRPAVLVVPNTPRTDGKWLFKTEYFGAFPAFELEMLEKGYYLAHIDNITRWCLPEDTDVKPRFAEFLHQKFGLCKKCFPVGMSCGGMQAIYFAAKYPEYVAAMYLDAPVVNLLSCPCGVGVSHDHPAHLRLYDEFVRKTGKTVSDLINDRNQPFDHLEELARHRIPVFLVCGDADHTVPYCENGAYLSEVYRRRGCILEEVLKPGCDHHPHGPDDLSLLIDFAEKYY